MKKCPDQECLKAGRRIRPTDGADGCRRGNKTEKCWAEICFRSSWSSHLIDTFTFRGNGFFTSRWTCKSLIFRGNLAVMWCLWKNPSTVWSQNLRGQKRWITSAHMIMLFLVQTRMFKTARTGANPMRWHFIKKLTFTHTPGHRVRGFSGSFIRTHFLSSPFHKGAIPCIAPSTWPWLQRLEAAQNVYNIRQLSCRGLSSPLLLLADGRHLNM